MHNLILISPLLLLTLLFSETAEAQTPGCTDPLASNFNSLATQNDGSCTYAASNISPTSSVDLPVEIIETSGLVWYDGELFSHNDNSDTALYQLDTITGAIFQTIPLPNVSNMDWEEISQDATHLYIGDFGNNLNGNRTDLHILRIDKNSLLSGNPIMDTIWFNYSTQLDFSPTGGNNTDYDCEAFIVGSDSIFLFTKEWNTNGTAIFAIPKNPGTHIAAYKDHLAVGGLITGATYFEQKNLIVLCGYSSFLQPFIYLLYDFNSNDFFGGNKRKIGVSLPFHQIEGIASGDGEKYFVSNEAFSMSTINVTQQLHVFDLNIYLDAYLHNSASIPQLHQSTENYLFPNPSDGFAQIHIRQVPTDYFIYNSVGQLIFEGTFDSEDGLIDVSTFNKGIYFIHLLAEPACYLTFEKK